MASPTPSDHGGGVSATLTRLDRNVASLSTALSDALTEINALRDRVEDLEAAVTAPAKAPKDDLNDRIVAFLDSLPGIKFSPVVIGENIGCTVDGRVAERCLTLVNQRKIRRHDQQGRNPLYSSRKKAQP